MKTAGDSGKLFGSVTAGDIVAAIKKAGGPNLDKRTVHLPKAHIKSLGSHSVEVHLHPGVNASVSSTSLLSKHLHLTALIRPVTAFRGGFTRVVAVWAGELTQGYCHSESNLLLTCCKFRATQHARDRNPADTP